MNARPKRQASAGPRQKVISEIMSGVTRADLEARGYDLEAVNPHAKTDEDARTPEQLLDIIEEQGRVVKEAAGKLRELIRLP